MFLVFYSLNIFSIVFENTVALSLYLRS